SSPCLMTNAFCASVNFDAFMPRPLAQPRKTEAKNSSSKRSSFQGTEQQRRRCPGFNACTGRTDFEISLITLMRQLERCIATDVSLGSGRG
ncbi:MAG: hypothetical protein ACK5SX_12525, partial [Sandaracinobacter sp.]